MLREYFVSLCRFVLDDLLSVIAFHNSFVLIRQRAAMPRSKKPVDIIPKNTKPMKAMKSAKDVDKKSGLNTAFCFIKPKPK